jgi:hypothetical protein
MNSRFAIALSVSVPLLVATLSGALLMASHSEQWVNVPALLDIPQSAVQLELFAPVARTISSAGSDSGSVSLESVNYYRAPKYNELMRSERINSDGSVSIDYFASSSLKPERLFTLIFAPPQAGAVGARLKEKIIYAGGGIAVKSDVTFDELSGLRTASSIMDAAGDFVNSVYYPGGANIQEQDVLSADGSTSLSIRHFRMDGSLAISSILDQDDYSRLVVTYDANELPSRVTHSGGANETAGETVQIYFPGTRRLRVESSTDGGTTIAHYFRPDGTLESQWTMTYSQLTVLEFDATGKRISSQSVYAKATLSSVIVDGIEVDHSTWTIEQVTEKKPDGSDARLINFTAGQPPPNVSLASIPARERTVDSSDNLPLPPSPYVDFD